MNTVNLKRKELYDLIWSTPMTSLAKKYLISDSGLRKICKKYEIPLPKAGHWEKLRAGKEVDIIELPTDYKGENEITLTLRSEGDNSIKGQLSPEEELRDEIEDDSRINLIVPDKLTNPHKLVAETKHAHFNNENRFSKNFTGYLRSPLSISATKLLYGRALRIMDTFIKAMEKRGHLFQLKNESVRVIIFGEEFEIAIREKNKRIPKPKTNSSWQEYDYIPSGILVFSLRISYHNIEWTDGKTPLENQLSKIIAKLEIKGAEERDRHLRWEKEREIKEEQDRLKGRKNKRLSKN